MSQESLLQIQDVMKRTGIKKSTIYQKIKAGQFPAFIKIGTMTRWVESEISAWVQKQISLNREFNQGGQNG